MKAKKYCVGCDNNYYNGNNNVGIKECWGYRSTKVVTVYRIGWWIPQDRRENFVKVKTHNCYTERGKNAFYDKLPIHLT